MAHRLKQRNPVGVLTVVRRKSGVGKGGTSPDKGPSPVTLAFFYHRRLLDVGYCANVDLIAFADLSIDVERRLEALHPGHDAIALFRALILLIRAALFSPRYSLRTPDGTWASGLLLSAKAQYQLMRLSHSDRRSLYFRSTTPNARQTGFKASPDSIGDSYNALAETMGGLYHLWPVAHPRR